MTNLEEKKRSTCLKCPAHEHGTSCQQADQVAKRPFKSNPFGVEEIQQQKKIKKSLGAF